ncbi:unnamed protein product [Schistosoma mattheei]|uniref:C2 domain-containing protein n=1 Tax=Schistosoma mattheei TaxID=31246 RepID=A0AA85BLJ6_9TREM|nr:unnamed protein product [Schistosoma mattheei]
MINTTTNTTITNTTTTTTTSTININNENQTLPYQLDPLSNNQFLLNLTKLFHVSSIPLAIFILITICILCLTFIILLILYIRTFMHKKYIPKVYKKREQPIYIDDIPGLIKVNNNNNNDNNELLNYGTIEYSLNYNLNTEELKICIVQANNLLVTNEQEPLNPYATISLIKYKNNNSQLQMMKPIQSINKKYTTNIIYNSNKPCWNQSFLYKLSINQLKCIIILLEIFHYNNQYIDQFLGHLLIPLNQINHSEYIGKFYEKIDWLLMNNRIYPNNIGEICIGLGYYTDTSRIDLCIFEIKNLILNNTTNTTTNNNDKGKLIDALATELDLIIYIKYNNHLLHKYKTESRKELINPYFNKTISFKIKEKYIKHLYIIIQLRQIHKWLIKKIIGELSISLNALQLKSMKHFNEMIQLPNQLHVKWHPIYPITTTTTNNNHSDQSILFDWLCFDPFSSFFN